MREDTRPPLQRTQTLLYSFSGERSFPTDKRRHLIIIVPLKIRRFVTGVHGGGDGAGRMTIVDGQQRFYARLFHVVFTGAQRFIQLVVGFSFGYQN